MKIEVKNKVLPVWSINIIAQFMDENLQDVLDMKDERKQAVSDLRWCVDCRTT